MSLKPTAFLASATGDSPVSRSNNTESCNGCCVDRTDSDFEAGSDLRGNGGENAITARFWAKVNRAGPIPLDAPTLGPCWLWTANATGRGRMHGQFAYRSAPGAPRRQVHVYAHRYAWTLTYGHVPDGFQLNHRCNVGLCVRPDHLYLGTQGDNVRDGMRAGHYSVPKTHKLTLAQRLAIFRDPDRSRGSGVRLAQQLGVTEAVISFTRAGRFVGSGVWFGTKPIDRGQAALHRCFERVPHLDLPVIGEVA